MPRLAPQIICTKEEVKLLNQYVSARKTEQQIVFRARVILKRAFPFYTDVRQLVESGGDMVWNFNPKSFEERQLFQHPGFGASYSALYRCLSSKCQAICLEKKREVKRTQLTNNINNLRN